jgi:hypothetical protein
MALPANKLRLALALSVASYALHTQRARAAPVVDGCSESMYVDRTAPDADRSLAWDFNFGSSPERCLIVRAGQQVTWVGNFGDHPIDADEGDQPNPTNRPPGGVVTFDRPGVFGYRCTFHLFMQGAVMVVPSLDCPAGQFGPSGQAPCQSCAPGSFSATAGQSACAPCPAGSIAAQAGATSCSACAPGTVPDPQRSACVAATPVPAMGGGHHLLLAGLVLLSAARGAPAMRTRRRHELGEPG